MSRYKLEIKTRKNPTDSPAMPKYEAFCYCPIPGLPPYFNMFADTEEEARAKLKGRIQARLDTLLPELVGIETVEVELEPSGLFLATMLDTEEFSSRFQGILEPEKLLEALLDSSEVVVIRTGLEKSHPGLSHADLDSAATYFLHKRVSADIPLCALAAGFGTHYGNQFLLLLTKRDSQLNLAPAFARYLLGLENEMVEHLPNVITLGDLGPNDQVLTRIGLFKVGLQCAGVTHLNKIEGQQYWDELYELTFVSTVHVIRVNDNESGKVWKVALGD